MPYHHAYNTESEPHFNADSSDQHPMVLLVATQVTSVADTYITLDVRSNEQNIFCPAPFAKQTLSFDRVDRTEIKLIVPI